MKRSMTALVIGNGAYPDGHDLDNPVHDADDLGAKLKSYGFDVIAATDCSFKEMDKQLKRFGTALNSNDVGLFFFAGHGMQIDGSNYLLALDTDMDGETDAKHSSLSMDKDDGIKVYKLPAGGARTIAFATDVENEYFDRTDDPGQLTIAVMAPAETGGGGGSASVPSREGDLLSVTRASPTDGMIRVGLRASDTMQTGDAVKVRATLSSPHGDLIETVLVRITDPERKPPKPRPEAEPPLGIPELVLCSKEGGEGRKSWDEIQEAGVEMDYDVVVQPFVDEDKLSRIYVNVDSSVLKDFNGAAKSMEAAELAERRYVSAVYFHTLFLFATTKSRKYDLRRGADEAAEDVEIAEYISDIFSSSYAQFLLNFETSDLIDAMN